MSEIAQRLGARDDEAVLIVSVGGLGSSYAANLAGFEALRRRTASTAALMVPAPWARGAAAAYRGEDVGVELTLNAELDTYRWGPITHAPSLLDGDGGFPRTVDDVWEHADIDEVRREWRAQIERAIYWGFDVSHLSAYLPGVELKPEFFDVYLDFAAEFRLPLRLPSVTEEARVGFPFRELVAEAEVLASDRTITIESDVDLETLLKIVRTAPPGVTEVNLRPGADTPELRAAMPQWQDAVAAAELLARPEVSAALSNARLVGYRELRSLMR
jgi:chitin disaccharide deacetylase